jgi:hypothetical protein
VKQRTITADERALVEKLLSLWSFEGKVQPRFSGTVEEIDEQGSLKFVHTNDVKARQKKWPVEGQYRDDDGVWIHVLLFLVGDEVDELEFFKDDSSIIVRKPLPQEWEMIDLS